MGFILALFFEHTRIVGRRLVEVEDAGQAADRTAAQIKVFNRTFTRDDVSVSECVVIHW